MIQRRQARELALQALFQMEFTPQLALSQFLNLFDESFDSVTIEMTQFLVNGVQDHRIEVDSIIQKCSAHWKLERMGIVDRNILRVAIFEMLFADTPLKPNIAINEALEIAKKFSSSDATSFINGLLDQASKHR